MKAPIMSEVEFEKCSAIADFNRFHRTSLNNWGEVLGADLAWVALNSDALYQVYINWYKFYFSKLAEALR